LKITKIIKVSPASERRLKEGEWSIEIVDRR
jgi:hypothetical protein